MNAPARAAQAHPERRPVVKAAPGDDRSLVGPVGRPGSLVHGAKVANLDRPPPAVLAVVAKDKDVGRLDVAMAEARLVDCGEAARHPIGNLSNLHPGRANLPSGVRGQLEHMATKMVGVPFVPQQAGNHGSDVRYTTATQKTLLLQPGGCG